VTLLHDYTRCHDRACPKADRCARFLFREDGGEHTPHVPTFRETDEDCDEFLFLYDGEQPTTD